MEANTINSDLLAFIQSYPPLEGAPPNTKCRVLRLAVLHRLDRLVRCQYRVCEIRVVDERCLIAVAPFGVLWRSRCIFCDCYTTYTVR